MADKATLWADDLFRNRYFHSLFRLLECRPNYTIVGVCVLVGAVRIAEGVTIAANAVVVRDIDEPYITVGGIPARKISDSSVKKKA